MKKLKATNGVIIIFMILFSILFLVLFGRIIYIQATGEVEGVNLDDWAKNQRLTSYDLPAERGQIYDRTGMVLADNRPTYRLYAVLSEDYKTSNEEPLYVVDPYKTAEQLAPYLSLDVNVVSNLLEQDKYQVEFTNTNFTEQEKQEIEKLNLTGIYFSKHSERYYPNGQFASHVIGFTQKKEDIIKGAMGIENALDNELSGTPGKISFQRDNYTTKLLEPDETIQQAVDGHDVYLTIDQKIQTFLEDAMTDVYQQYEPEKIMAVVMNPKTGEVLAMSNRPSFDPNVRENIQNWYNDIIAYPFEPGSTMKIFTLAAAIDSGHYNGNETYKSGTYTFLEDARDVHDHNWGKGWDYISFDEGFLRSSNVAMAKLVWEKMGTETFLEYLKRFDLDKETGIDLSGEVKGTIMYNWPAEKVTTSYGQGTTVTPMQLMKAATAVANGGEMMQPYVISKIVESNTGKVLKQTEPKVVGTPITKETSDRVKQLLEQVVSSEKGTGYDVYNLDDYSVAGKTGTAQIVNPETNKYYTGDREAYVFSFLGMAPAENPELMMYVAVKKPTLDATESGSEPVSYIFKTVMENSLRYLEIQPSKEKQVMEVEPFTLPSYQGDAVQDVVEELSASNLHVQVMGEGSIVKEMYPLEGTSVIQGSTVFLRTDGIIKMPNIEGWSLREVLQLGDFLNISVDYSGNGFIVTQSIPVGSEIKASQTLKVELQSPGTDEFTTDEGVADETESIEQE